MKKKTLFKPEDMASATMTFFNSLAKNDDQIRKLLKGSMEINKSTYMKVIDDLSSLYFLIFVNCLANQAKNREELIKPFVGKASEFLVSIYNEIGTKIGFGTIDSKGWLSQNFARGWLGTPSGEIANWINDNHRILQLEAYEDEGQSIKHLLRLVALISIHTGISPKNNFIEFLPLYVSLSSICSDGEEMIINGYKNGEFVFDIPS